MAGILVFLGLIATSSAQNLSFSALKNHLITNKVGSIEAALPGLVAKYPDYFTFNTMMYGSLSLQESSFEQPRVIVFGSDAKFVLSFTGHENMRGGMSFESMEYDNHEFKFRSIVFKYPGWSLKEAKLHPNEVEFETDQLIVSKPNPEVCLRCHGQNAGPIWTQYFLWQGAFGSDDDHLYMSFDRASWNPNNKDFFMASTTPQSQGRGMILKAGHKDTELDAMVDYVKARPQHPRYKWLPKMFIEDGIIRHANGVPLPQLDYSAQAKAERERLGVNYQWPSRPNGFLLDALADLNQDRIISRLSGLKDVYKSPWWSDFAIFVNNLPVGSFVDLREEILRGLNMLPFKGARPTGAEVDSLIVATIKADAQDQRGRMQLHESYMGQDSLRYFPRPGQTGFRKLGLDWIGDPVEALKAMLGIQTPTHSDVIAFNLETDDVAELVVLQILLKDRGVDLGEYNMNLGRRSRTFHSSGLERVKAYLGIK